LAQEWDSRSAQFAYQNANNVIGVLGTDPTSVQPYYDARRRMKELACPPGGKRGMIISSSMMSSFGQNITTFFHPADEISKMFKEGSLGKAAGFDWFESNSLWSHTAGTAVTSLAGHWRKPVGCKLDRDRNQRPRRSKRATSSRSSTSTR
jgi:hypothetical protein